jgi:subtilisin-like proprotein convertase family protein
MAAAQEKLAWDYPGAYVEIDDVVGGPAVVHVHRGGKHGHAARAHGVRNEETVRNFLTRYSALYGLTEREVAELEKTADYTNPAGNLSWVSFQQKIDGIPVFGGELRAALTSSGELVRTVSGLAPGLSEGADRNAVAAPLTVSAAEAVSIAAASIGVTVEPESFWEKAPSPDGRTVTFEPGPFAEAVKVDMVYFPVEPGLVRPAWSMVLWQDGPAFYVIVDANVGALLWRKNITNDQTQPATYVVYNDDSPGPLSPSNALPGSGIQGAAIPRTSFTLTSELSAFDNLGWMTDGVNTTTGNNVDAGLDIVPPNGIDPAGRAVGSPFRVFDFPYNPAPGIPPPGDAPTLANYRMGVVTDLFFWSNRYHDRLYELGFTEAAGNFQTSNFGRGGAGNDHVLAEAQDSAGTNNARFTTPPDGASGRMEMFIFNGPNPDRDGSLDHEIVIHELTHGLSNRLHANASGLNTSHSGGMGEGWSDFYARALLSTASEDVNGIYAAGPYVTLQLGPLGTDNYYYGIRRFPYAVKTTVGANGRPHNPLTFADVDPAQINTTDGAFPETPLGWSGNGAAEVHNIGEIWCMALLEVRARMITRLGFATGNQRALQIVTDGMKLDPANPNLLQGRDSILAADCAGFGGADELDIWAGFAARGMGYSARHNPGLSVTEAFDVPNLLVGSVTISSDSCNGDGFADPGETMFLTVPLTNPFCGTPANGVTASVDGGAPVNYGNIPPGATVAQSIPYTVPADAACGSQIAVPVNIHSSLGSVARTFNLQIGRPIVSLTATYSSGNLATPIPDLGSVEIPINVSDVGSIEDIDVRVRLNHSFDGDLIISLIAPDGTTVILSANRGGAGDNFGTGPNDCSGTSTEFDDAAATAIGATTAPFAGTFRPDSPLSAFNGKATNGTWRLRIADTGAVDTGTVGCVELQIIRTRYACCGVPGFAEIQAGGPAILTAESCVPGNDAPDPNETVTMSFPLTNIGTDSTTNLVATLLPGGGVNSPSGPQTYGALDPGDPAVSRPFTFMGSGACGSQISATLQLQDGATDLGTVTFTIQIGITVTSTSTFSNAASVAIPGTGTGAATGAPASPYPSTITVSGITNTVTKVTVTLTNFNHTFPADVDVLLRGPGGQKMLLMSDVGGGTDAVNVTLTFDDSALAIGATVVSGTFRPTNIGAGDLFPATAPAGPYPDPQLLSVFNGVSPNGTWSLFVVDDAATDTGNFSGGWTLRITTSAASCDACPCVLTCPSDVVVPANLDLCAATVGYPAPTFTGGCGTVTCSPPSGSLFPVGTTTVTCSTPEDSCSFTVTVTDAEAPGAGSATVTFPNPTATDNCGATVMCSPASGSSFPVGTTTVTCTATDSASNTDSCSFAVTVTALCVPPAPATVAGATSVIAGDADPDADMLVGYTYSVPAQSGASYTWSVSPGATIWSGQGTNAVQIIYDNSPGPFTVSVTIDSGCGTTTPSLAVSKTHDGFSWDFLGSGTPAGWTDEIGTWSQSAGAYENPAHTPAAAIVYESASYGQVYGDFTVEAELDATRTTPATQGAASTLWIRGTPTPLVVGTAWRWNSGFAFNIANTGKYSIFKYTPTGNAALQAWVAPVGTTISGPTKLKVVASGTTMTFYVNDVVVKTLTNQTQFTSGKVGVAMVRSNTANSDALRVNYAKAAPSPFALPKRGAASAAQRAANAEANRRRPRANPLFDEDR